MKSCFSTTQRAKGWKERRLIAMKKNSYNFNKKSKLPCAKAEEKLEKSLI